MAIAPRPPGRSRSMPIVIGAVAIVAAVAIYLFAFAGAGYDNRAEQEPVETQVPTGSTPGTTLPAAQ